MAADTELTLYTIMQEMRQKYTYFLLAATAASVGFAVTQTKDAHISCDMIPLGLAIMFWALSFYFGCRYLHKRSVAIGTNIELLKLREGRHPQAGTNAESIAIGLSVMEPNYKTTNNQVGFAYRWQFRLFILASVAFLAWHIWQMWVRT